MARLNYEVQISGADNGLVVRLGCKTIVFKDSDMAEFLADLSTYLTKGREGEMEMYKKYFGDPAEGLNQGCTSDEPCEVPAYRGGLR